MSPKLLALLNKIFGSWTWQKPSWVTNYATNVSSQPKTFWLKISAVILLLLGIAFGWHIYKSLPQPELITAQIQIPEIVSLPGNNANSVLPISPLTIVFSKTAAPLNLVGKNIDAAKVTISPNLPGTWQWSDDKTLKFLPTQNWPAGQTFKINCDKKIFAPTVKLAKYTYTFTTSPFTADIKEFKFYQDPIKQKIKKAVATIQFNYPVDVQSAGEKIILERKGSNTNAAQKIAFTITYDQYKRTAYLQSVPLNLETQEYYLNLTLNKGIAPISGNPTLNTITKDLLIPNQESFAKISSINATIVRNEQDRPEQVLNIETTSGVSTQELAKSLHVYLLPAAKNNQNWLSALEVTPTILHQATPVTLTAIPANQEYATLHSYKFNVPATDTTTSYLYVKVDNGMKFYADYTLSTPYLTLVSVPTYPKEISFLHPGSILALNSEKKVSILIRGLPAIKIKIARVLPDTVNQLVSQTEGKFSSPSFLNSNFGPNNITEVFTEIHQFDNAESNNKIQYLALDLTKYLATTQNPHGPHGLFLLEITGWDPSSKTELDVNNKRLILVTDLGIIAKNNADNTHDVFVNNIISGQPAAEATITILGKNGLPILSRITDNQGHANLPNLTAWRYN